VFPDRRVRWDLQGYRASEVHQVAVDQKVDVVHQERREVQARQEDRVYQEVPAILECRARLADRAENILKMILERSALQF